MKSKRVSILLFLIVLIVIGLVLATVVAHRYIVRFAEIPLKLDSAKTIELPKGMSLKNFSKSLSSTELVQNERLFYFWVKYFSDYSKFQAGLYRFEGEVTPKDISTAIIQGEIYEPVVFKLVVPEGYSVQKIAEKLAQDNIAAVEDVLSFATDPEFLRKWNIHSSSVEGYLYPATYNFIYYPNVFQLFDIMVENFWKKLPKDYEQRAKSLGITLNEAVTIASLIELETKFVDEMPLVSEVIWNRLKRKARLEIDASVIYGIKEFDGDIKWKHLKDSSNAYNTRIHAGLPPTPIGSPSLNALLAVLNPTNKGYYFYVVDVDSPNGSHHFSKSLKEHNSYVRKLVRLKKSEQRARKRTK